MGTIQCAWCGAITESVRSTKKFCSDYCRTRNWQVAGNPEAKRRAAREWYRRNQEREAQNGAAYRAANREKIQVRHRAYAQSNRELRADWERARRSRKRGGGGSFTAEEFAALCAAYGGRCLACGLEQTRLTADHVVPVALGGASDISNIQPLCQPCNSRKGTKIIDYRPKKVA
jgi:5-methylcytosine-specific restriction endonuclease McrA